MTDHPGPDETERDVPGIDSAIDAAAKALANWHCVEYRYASGKAQAKWRIQAEVAVRAWQEYQRRTAEESVPESHRAERQAADELALTFDEVPPWACGYSANRAQTHHREVKALVERIIELQRTEDTLRAELNAEGEDWVNPVEHARIKYELKDARAELSTLRAENVKLKVDQERLMGVVDEWHRMHDFWFGEWAKVNEELGELKAAVVEMAPEPAPPRPR